MPDVYELAIQQRTFSRQKTNSIGVTALIDSPYIRKLWQEHEDEITVDIADEWFKFRGSMTHQVLEGVRIPNAVKELYLQVPLTGNRGFLSGVIDLWLPYSLEDYKVKSVNSFFYHKRLDEDQNEQQLNIYKWLLFHTFGVNNIKTLKIHHLFFDWVAKKAQVDHSYPQSPHVLYPTKLWDLETTEKFINEKLDLHADPNPPVCTKVERWTRENVYALTKDGGKRATKIFSTLEAANMACNKGYYVDTRPGADVRCESYCNVRTWCAYWQEQEKQFKKLTNPE